ncbi:MAG: metalloregulator ArsR/SmtB family transcription factor [Gemmatimonadota bacterium]|nr:metalloregulator ArsR/SmtB family transcription factor [Gemmatimonadota bacterium]
MNGSTPPIFDRLTALSDPTRGRLLSLLDRHELTVTEMCSVTQLPQSTVSRHLKVLGDGGWVTFRADGTSRRYRGVSDRLDATGRRLWTLVREQVSTAPSAQNDTQRLRSVLAERRSASQEFFSTSAGQWDRLRGDLFGSRADVVGLLGLLDEKWTVADLGCGTGQVSEMLAPFVASVVAVDESPAMLTAARRRLKGFTNVSVREGDLGALPVDDESMDAALLFLVLHYTADPAEVFTEIRRILKPDGRLLIVDMMPHERAEFRNIMGHVWQGFAAAELSRWIEQAGLHELRYHPLPADPVAKGPTLFAASARRAMNPAVVSTPISTPNSTPNSTMNAASRSVEETARKTAGTGASRIAKPKAGARAGHS